MTGYEKAKKIAEELKAENAVEEERQLSNFQGVKNSLAKIENQELAALYKQNATLGAENLGGNAPYLRIHTGTSTANELSDGSYPKEGNFFYNPTKEEFSEILCHILYISGGFKLLQENKKEGTSRLQFNQLLAGVIVNDGEEKPFLMYINGLKCQPLWKFGKEASEFTKAGVPMYSMTVRITTEQVKSEYGMKWIPKFEIVKEDGNPILVLDLEEFKMLKEGVIKAKENIQRLIQAKASEDAAINGAPIDGEAV